MTTTDRVAGDHRDHRLRQPSDLDMQIAHIEPADTLFGDVVIAYVAIVATDPLIAS